MMQLLAGPFGAYTPQAASAIAAALAQAGLGTTGNVFYCDPVNGLDTNDGQTPATTPGGHGPVQSLLGGYNLLRSGFNDCLVLIGNGAASGSARITSFTWAKNAAHLLGICAPSTVSQRARIANPTTAGLVITANFFTVSGNGCLFSNLSWFQGAGAGQTGIAAAILMTITGSRNAFLNCDFEGMGDLTASVSSTSRSILIVGPAGENRFQHCNIGLDTIARTSANASVEITTGSPRNSFEDCTFLFFSADGLQYALLAAAPHAIDRWQLFKGCNFIVSVGSLSGPIAQLFHLVSGAAGILVLDPNCGAYGVTAMGDATTLAQVWLGGGTATDGVKGIVAS